MINVLDHGFVRLVENLNGASNKKLRFRIPSLEKKIQFLLKVRESGTINEACRDMSISRYTVTQWRRQDREFDSYVLHELAVWRGTEGVRKCIHCLHIKPLTEFTARSDRPGQQKSTCKVCHRSRQMKLYHSGKAVAFFRHKANRVRSRASSLHVPCDIDAKYLKDIWTGICPVRGVKLIPSASRSDEDAPELDRIVPSLGYMRGNVAWLSRKANRIKNNVSLDEMKQLVAWLEHVLKGDKCAA